MENKERITQYNVLNYLDMRGDLTFDADPFNDVDNLLLTQLSYIDLTGVVGEEGGFTVPLPEAVDRFFELHSGEELHLGAVIPDDYFEMFRRIGKARRFADLRLACYRYTIKEQDGGRSKVQWTAETILLDDRTMYISFAGTDDTLISWKEDLDMALREVVPSQAEAADYVREILALFPRYDRVMIGGHSKGGNLAVFSAAKCAREEQSRILRVYDNDGPGFAPSFLEEEGYRAIRHKIVSIVPEKTIVGLMLDKDTAFRVVKSSAKGAFQHDTFSWLVRGGALDEAPAIAHDAVLLRETTRRWLASLSDSEKADFVEYFYDFLTGADAKTLTDLTEDPTWFFTSYRKMPPEGRRSLRGALRKFLACRREVQAEDAKEQPTLSDGKEKDGQMLKDPSGDRGTLFIEDKEKRARVSPASAKRRAGKSAVESETSAEPTAKKSFRTAGTGGGKSAGARAAQSLSGRADVLAEDAKTKDAKSAPGAPSVIRALFGKEEKKPVVHLDGTNLYGGKAVKKKQK
ncbi:MAG: DUF2974 domain-containing protein [Clostridia bacterium]|nr:DUF2974 domain-containing protein [Clostridia bacterium]